MTDRSYHAELSREERDTRAKLLADRAELVAALERIEQTLDYGQFSNALTLARAALAKAKG